MTHKRWAGFILATVPAISLAAWASVGSKAPSPESKTRENLAAVLRGEAFAYVKYRLYAAKARQEGHEDMAKVFEAISDQERLEHFAEFAEIYGLVGNTAQNLQEAIRGETHEATVMYPQFAATARAEGASSAAERFEEVARDEAKHVARFKSFLQSLQLASGPAEEVGP